VSDAHTQTLHAPPIPMVYFPVDQKGADIHTTLTNLDVRVAGDPGAAASGIRDAIRRAEPDLLLGDVGPMSQRLARDLNRERLVAWLAVSFGALTLLLAALGLYGVLSYGVSQRTQEIGVRMALGARPIQVVRAVLGQSVALTIAGIAGGLLASAAGARSLSGMLFGVTPLDVPTLIGVPLVFVAVLTLASYLPARRATKVDPLVALRCE
jgi:putative ABC transport system permease protein